MKGYPSADWDRWKSIDFWSFRETACLMHGVDPTENAVKFGLTGNQADRSTPVYKTWQYLSNIPPERLAKFKRGRVDLLAWGPVDQLLFLKMKGENIPPELSVILPGRKVRNRDHLAGFDMRRDQACECYKKLKKRNGGTDPKLYGADGVLLKIQRVLQKAHDANPKELPAPPAKLEQIRDMIVSVHPKGGRGPRRKAG